MLCREAFEQRAANVDVLMLSRNGATVYNGPLRLALPYFLSIGVGDVACSVEAFRDILASPDVSTPLLDGQVRTCRFAPSVSEPIWSFKTAIVSVRGSRESWQRFAAIQLVS